MRFVRRRHATNLLAFLLLATSVIPVSAANPAPDAAPAPALGAARIAPVEQPASDQDDTGLRSSIHWEEIQKHANDKIDFAPGGRVTVPFRPRAHDRWTVGGVAPRALPEGRLSGRQLREALKPTPATAPTATPEPEPTVEPDPTAAPVEAPSDPPAEPPADPSPDASSEPAATPAATDTPVDQPVLDEGEAIPAEGVSWAPDLAAESLTDPAAAISPGGLKREVFGFLPYWEVSDSSTTIDYSKVSTIAYFGVGAAANGSLEKTNKDGSTTTGWNGWTSSAMTNVINKAHQSKTRVVLTVQSFAWSSGGSTKQKALLGSSTARAALAKNIAVAVRDRGADGVNLDFEPLAAGYADEFVLLVKRVRTELNAVAKGYQLTFDTTGYIGNYPLEAATAAGGADAIFIMGYDYRSSGSSPVGSIAPIGGAAYDITDTIKAYTARVPASKLILGVPYYGRAWSTDSDKIHAKNISGTKYGSSTAVIYDNGIGVLQEHGRRRDNVEGVAWTAYRRENCSSTYGCVTSWRQLYMDDAYALRVKYDLVNSYGLRGAGIWALGYDNARPELWAAIKDKFVALTPFTDVNGFATEIAWLYQSGITGGCSPTLFCPKGKVSRVQMAMFLDRALDLPAATVDYYDDDDGKTGEGQHQRPGQGQDHERLRPAPLLPERLCHPRPDGDVPGPRAGPAQRHDRLLRRRRRPDRRGQHQRARPVQDHRRLRAASLLPDELGHARADGRIPVPRPPAGPPRLRSAATLQSMIDPAARVHASAELEAGVSVGAGSSIWQRAQVRTGARIGTECVIGRDAFIDQGVEIGDRVKIQNGALVYNGVTVADGVFIGPGVILTNDRYPRAITAEGELARADDWEVTPIRLEHGSSIGAGAIVVAGCDVGPFAMVGAGAVVTRTVPGHALVAGSPAKRIGWVCACGDRLIDSEGHPAPAEIGRYTTDPELTCARCGRHYAYERAGDTLREATA